MTKKKKTVNQQTPKVNVEKEPHKPEKSHEEEDIEPDTTDNPGVTHISPPCNEG